MEFTPDDFPYHALLDCGEIISSYFCFSFSLPIAFLDLRWGSALSLFGVEPPALPCGSAWGFPRFLLKPCLWICLVRLLLIFRNLLLLLLLFIFLPHLLVVFLTIRLLQSSANSHTSYVNISKDDVSSNSSGNVNSCAVSKKNTSIVRGDNNNNNS